MSRKVIIAFYKDLFEALKLTPSEIEQFVRMRAGEPAKREGGMIDLLGPAGFERYQNYTRDIRARSRLNEARDRLLHTSEPLRPWQRAVLLKILREEQHRGPVDFERCIEARAAKVLSPAQLEKFRCPRFQLAMMRLAEWLNERSRAPS